MRLSVKFDITRALAGLQARRDEIAERAVPRALNRVATTVAAQSAREIAREFGRAIPVREVRKQLRIQRATRARHVAVVVASGPRYVPLTKFSVRQTRKGVTVRIGGRAVRIPHTFIAAKGSREAVYVRAQDFRGQRYTAVRPRVGPGSSKGQKRKWGAPDMPIAELLAPGVPQLFIAERVRRNNERIVRERFPIVLAQEIKFRSRRA